MKVLKNYLWNIGYQIFIILVPLVTVPYINRVLGPTGVGINAYTNSVVQYFILLGSLGINLYGSRGTAYIRDDQKKLTTYFWELAFLRIICIVIALAVYLGFTGFSEKYRWFYLAQGLALAGTALDISWFFQGLENFRITVLRNMFVKVASIVLIFTMVHTPDDTMLYILILAFSQLLGNLTMWPSVRRYVKSFPGWKQLNLKKHIRPAVGMLVPQLAIQIYVQLNKTMLGMLVGVTASGFYDNSDKIIKILLAVVTATGTVLLPHVANNFARGNSKAVQRSLKISMHIILALAFPLAFGIASVASPFTFYFFSVKFMPVAQLMMVESIVVIPIAISNAIGVQYLLPTNQMKPYTTSVILGSIVNIVLNVPLILRWEALGAIIATVLSETAVMVYQIWFVRKQIDLGELFSESWKYFAAGLGMFFVVQIVQHSLPRSILSLIIEVVVGAFVYLVLFIIFRPKIVLGYLSEFAHAHFIK